MNLIRTNKLILHLHQLHIKSDSQPFNLKFVIFQGEQNTQTKLQSRKQITLSNNTAHIEEAFELGLAKDGKILMIILKTKLKQTSFLGQISIDVNRYLQQGLETINLQAPISKCAIKDQGARLLLTLTFPTKKQPLRQFQIQRALNKQTNPKQTKPSIVTSAESAASKSESQSTVRNDKTRRVSTDFYKKNYKNAEILREDKSRSREDSKAKERSGSYKKRFQYQEGMKSKSKNTIVFMKQKKEKFKDKEEVPVARERTPEPIKLDRLSHSSHSKARPSKVPSVRPRQATERSAEKPDKMFISIHAKTERFETESEAVNDQRQHTFSKDSSIHSIVEDNKYGNLVDKLREIETKIEDKKSIERSFEKYIGRSRSKSKSHSNSNSQSQSLGNSTSKKEGASPSIPNSPSQQPSPSPSQPQAIEDSVNKSVESPYIKQYKLDQLKPQDRESVCTFGDAVKTSNQSNLPTANKLLIQQLTSKISSLQSTIKDLLNEKGEGERLIDKLTSRYQKLVEELESVRDPYEREIESLKEELGRLKKARESPIEKELKNQKRRAMNLENSLLLKQNELKHLKLNVKSLEEERRELQTLLAKKESKMGQNSSRALLQAEIMASGYPTAIRSQNQLLRSQIHLLQKHIQQLNELVQQYQLHNSQAVSILKVKQLQDLKQMNQLLTKNIEVQGQKEKNLEKQLRRTKMNFAEMMNVVFQKGGEELVEIIERRILERDPSGYISSDVQ